MQTLILSAAIVAVMGGTLEAQSIASRRIEAGDLLDEVIYAINLVEDARRVEDGA